MSNPIEYAPNGRLDLDTAYLGREVVTPREAIEIIRPQLRMCRALYRGQLDAIREGWLEGSPDLELTDGGDDAAFDGLFESLIEQGIENVKSWAGDEARVFDRDRLREFIRLALCNAMVDRGGDEMLHPGALDY